VSVIVFPLSQHT